MGRGVSWATSSGPVRAALSAGETREILRIECGFREVVRKEGWSEKRGEPDVEAGGGPLIGSEVKERIPRKREETAAHAERQPSN